MGSSWSYLWNGLPIALQDLWQSCLSSPDPPYLRNYQALKQVSGGHLVGLSDNCISFPISASLSFFLCDILIMICLFLKEKDKLTRRMFCNQSYFPKKAIICCFLHIVLERTRVSSYLLGVHSCCNLQTTDGKSFCLWQFQFQSLIHLLAVCFYKLK